MLNKTMLMGRLTANPNLRQTPNGVSVATFSLAVNRNYNRDVTDFINIVTWRQTADFVSRNFTKGQLVVVEGSIQTRSYEDKNGNKRVAFEVVAEQVYFTGANKNNTDKLDGLTPPPAPSTHNKQQTAYGEPPIDVNEYEEIPVYDYDYDELPF